MRETEIVSVDAMWLNTLLVLIFTIFRAAAVERTAFQYAIAFESLDGGIDHFPASNTHCV